MLTKAPTAMEPSTTPEFTIPPCFPPNLVSLWETYITTYRDTKGNVHRPTHEKHDLIFAILSGDTPDPDAFGTSTPSDVTKRARRDFSIRDGQLYHSPTAKYNRPQRVVLDEEVLGLMIAAHMGMEQGGKKKTGKEGGHFSCRPTAQRLRMYYNISRTEVEWLCKQCAVCNGNVEVGNKDEVPKQTRAEAHRGERRRRVSEEVEKDVSVYSMPSVRRGKG